MIKINIHDAKTNLSRYLVNLEKGETITLCKRNIPIAEIKPISQEEAKGSRPIGLAKGMFTVTDEFFKPLPDEVVDSFYNGL